MRLFLLTSFFLLSTFFTSSLFAAQKESAVEEQVLYMSYKHIPKRVVVGEIFSVTIKSVPTVKKFKDISYKFSDSKSIKVLNTKPKRSIVEENHFDTFNFQVLQQNAVLPHITASIIDAKHTYPSTTLEGEALNVIALNPPKNFSNIIANSFEILEYKTTKFDDTKNILVFTAWAQNSDITKMQFKGIFKQGSESVKASYLRSKITYFVVIDKALENFSFTYFNLKSNDYTLVNLPIILDDDSVVAQTDLKPKDQSKEQLKVKIATGVGLILFLIIMWKKQYKFLLILLIPLAYIVSVLTPSKDICVRSGANIHILPVPNGTIFEKTTQKSILPNEGHVKDFVKVKLKNDRIGWVKNEDICSN